jgi:hypothetical protein
MDRLADAINRANEAAAKLLRCAESISNPTYNVVMGGKQLTILAVSHFAGQISITVEDPAVVEMRNRRAAISSNYHDYDVLPGTHPLLDKK